ncbi:MAG: peptidylprolyl isomerase [Halothece sp. Uz-M2-17]|nr:peptidylprolyl isomerase [Halothece sp. Uz-M2-17]
MVAVPVLTNPIADLEVLGDLQETTINLFNNFDDPLTTGLVARFELFDETFPNEGVTEVLLFDQAGDGAPITVENFTNYIEDGDYVNSIIHRSIPDFVVQGGGFTVDGFADALAAENPASAISTVPTDEPIVNEFSPNRSNLEGTIAMAKLGDDPNSATSQWFFNLTDNSENLDNQNGGFTVFGEVLSDADFDVIEAIADLPTFNASDFLGQPAFTNLPLETDPDNPQLTDDEDFVRYESITLSQQPELQFAITNNSNPDLVTPSITEGELTLDYAENETGTAEITVEATNLVGETVTDTFSVNAVNDSQAVIRFGSLSGDNITSDAESLSRLIFTGAGDDTIDNQNSQQESTRLYGGSRDDRLIVGSSDRAFGGAGNDIIDASFGNGNNQLYAGDGDDEIILGRSDRAFGGAGNDRIIFTTGADNIIFGGTGSEDFRIESENVPSGLNTIGDFTSGEDQMTFVGFTDLDFTDLTLTASADGEDTLIGLDSLENDFIRLQGVTTNTLSETDFNFVA